MGYLKIKNLYKEQDILMFKEVYCLEKVHGTSAHIKYHSGKARFECNEKATQVNPPSIKFFSGGSKHETFVELFNEERLKLAFGESGLDEVTVYGEAYGGKCQGMAHTYGKELKFVAFDVKIGHCWLSVPKAEDFSNALNLDFVAYERVSTDLKALDAERDRPSRQAKKNGIVEDKIAEGIVIRPIEELRKNNGDRIICKHKRDEFMETKTPRTVDPEKQKILEEAREVANEWVTFNRLNNIFSHMNDICTENMGEIIGKMIQDIKREGEGEIVWSKAVEKQIGKSTALLVKQYFMDKLRGINND